jgi:hypothetical protein
MREPSWLVPVFLGLSLALVCTSSAAAQEPRLKIPTTALAIASAADWATTYHALKFYKVREANPLLRHLDDRPAKLVTLGAAIDAGAMFGWNYTVGRRNPKLAAAGLWTMTAFRAYLAIHNLRNERRAARR